MGLFVTGTGTEVGKTLVSTWLCLHQKFRYWKPVQTGSLQGTDTDFARSMGIDCYPEAYVFQEPLSPHTAARLEGKSIVFKEILDKRPQDNHILIEGAGGILVPLSETYLMVDLIQHLKVPVVVVAHSGLGTLNHTLLTLEALRLRNIEPLGVILNGPLNPQNRESLLDFGKTSILAELPPLSVLNLKTLLDIPLPEALEKIL